MKFLVVLCLLQVSIVLGGERICDRKMDLIFLLDDSGSIGLDIYEQYCLPFVNSIMSVMTIHPKSHQVGVITFSDGISAFINLDSPSPKDVTDLGATYVGGSTATGPAIDYATQMFINFGRPDTKKIVVVITDGQSNVTPPTVEDAVQDAYAKFPNLEFIVVGVEPRPGYGILDVAELELIASGYAQENVFICQSFAGLNAVVDDVVKSLCNPDPPCTTTVCDYSGYKGACLDYGCCWNAEKKSCFERETYWIT